MISKKLLSEVLSYQFCAITKLNESVDRKYISWTTYEKPRPHDWKQINVYELAHKCKEWALAQGWWIDSNLGFASIGKNGSQTKWKSFNGYDLKLIEYELVIIACEWILNDK